MTDFIYEELNKKVTLPHIRRDTIFIEETPAMFDKFLSDKQQIEIPQHELDAFIEYIYTHNMMVSTVNTEINGSNIHTITDPFDVSEYFGSSDKVIIDSSYLYTIKQEDLPLSINLYNVSSVDCIGGVGSERIRVNMDSLEGITVPSVKKIALTEFTEVKYNQDIHISKYMYKFPTLSVNLPYYLYSQMNIPENIFTYDFVTKTYNFAGKSKEEFLELFNEICNNGITRHLFISMSDGKLMSTDNDSYLILLIAMHLKIPTIPVTLYLISNTKEENLLISDRIADILWKINPNFDMDLKSYTEISDICYPYFMFYNKKFNNARNKRMIVTNESYVSMKDTLNKDPKDYDQVTLYIGDDPEKVLKEIEDLKLQENPGDLNKRLIEEAENSLNKTVENIIKQIKDGTL